CLCNADSLDATAGSAKMNNRDWDFALGSLGDPLSDINHWMLLPIAECHKELIDEYSRGERGISVDEDGKIRGSPPN
ncbi:unnamed protein product, partial [marine sediment metagenome]